MNYKIQAMINKNKSNLIIYAILWLVLTIGLVIPISHSITNATVEGAFSTSMFISEFMEAYGKLPTIIPETLGTRYIEDFFSLLLKATLIYIVLIIISLVKSKSGNEYRDIEHGSSDWCESGEQYSILSNKKGIILAENNYLPVDKRGNVNVLIVGRFRFW